MGQWQEARRLGHRYILLLRQPGRFKGLVGQEQPPRGRLTSP